VAKIVVASSLLPLAWWGAGRIEKRRGSDADAA
jgi:hypothetical protein